MDAQEGLERTQEVRVGIASGVLADVIANRLMWFGDGLLVAILCILVMVREYLRMQIRT